MQEENKYSQWKMKNPDNMSHNARLTRWKDVTSDDIRMVTLAILINIGLVKKPRYEDHWSTNLFLASSGILCPGTGS